MEASTAAVPGGRRYDGDPAVGVDGRPAPRPADITAVLGRFDPVFARGLQAILSDDPRVGLIAADVADSCLLSVIEERAADVAILDEPSEARLSGLHRARGARGGFALVVLADQPAAAYRRRLVTLGATCVEKRASAEEFLTRLHLTVTRPPSLQGSPGGDDLPDAQSVLTPREREVLGYLVDGLAQRLIADRLSIGLETVRTHSASIRAKLGVRSIRELHGVQLPGLTAVHSARPVVSLPRRDGAGDSNTYRALL